VAWEAARQNQAQREAFAEQLVAVGREVEPDWEQLVGEPAEEALFAELPLVMVTARELSTVQEKRHKTDRTAHLALPLCGKKDREFQLGFLVPVLPLAAQVQAQVEPEAVVQAAPIPEPKV